MRFTPLLLMLLLAAPLAAQQVTLPSRDRPLTGAPTQVFAIGREEGESWELLANVSGVDFDGADRLHVLDAGNHRVLVLDARGRLVRTIGKQGGGPGELLVPSGLAVLPDGSVVVADLGRSAFSVFAADGSFQFNIPFADSLGTPGPEQRGATPTVLPHRAGVAVFGTLRIAVGGPGQPRPTAPPTDIPLYLQQLDAGAPPRLLYRVPREAPVIRTSGSENNRSVRAAPRAFSPQAGWGVLPNGGVVAVAGNSPEYRITLLDASGRVQRTVTRALEPRRPTRADQDRAREQLAERLRNGEGMIRMEVRAGAGGVDRRISTGGPGAGASEADIEAQVRELEFADRIPVIAGIRTDPQGRIWVARTPRPAGGDGPIDLLDASGRYLGTLAPQPLPDAVSASGLAAYIERDDLGVERVAVRRLPAAWR